MTRVDIHRPSAIIPADYDYVGIEHNKPEHGVLTDVAIALENRERIKAHMARTGGTYSRHEHGGNCHVCGAHCIYTVLFHHRRSNVYIRTGFDCAENMEWDSGEGERFRHAVREARERQKGKAKAAALLGDRGYSAAWELYSTNPVLTPEQREEVTIYDIVSKLVQYGSLSDKQFNYIGALLHKINTRAERQAAAAARRDAAAEVPVAETRMKVSGVVKSIKGPNAWGQPRMLIEADAGWRVFGSIPAAINDVEVGQRVEFVAMVKASDRDSKFGFFNRPTNARKV